MSFDGPYEFNDYDEYEDEEDLFSCDNCGPWCDYWLGDGLCEIAIEEQAKLDEEYRKRHYYEYAVCPVCGESMPMYEFEMDEAFVVPADLWWIGLEAYGPLWIEKRILHEYSEPDGSRVLHIQVGDMEHLIKLLGSRRVDE